MQEEQREKDVTKFVKKNEGAGKSPNMQQQTPLRASRARKSVPRSVAAAPPFFNCLMCIQASKHLSANLGVGRLGKLGQESDIV